MSEPWAYQDFVRDALTRVPQITCEEVEKLGPRGVVLLDIREPDETAGGTIPGAILLPRGLLEKHVADHVPDRSSRIAVICATGNRSALAADVLLKMGYRNAANLAGGIERWRHLNRPIEGGCAVAHSPSAVLSWPEVRSEFAIVGRLVPVLGSAERPVVYMDHAATTHAPASVLQAYCEFLQKEYANVHRATHLLARKATERFEEAYTIVADFIGAELKQGCVCFTGNTTQALDLASHVMAERPGKILTTEMEHHSDELVHRRRGSILRARVTDRGELDIEHLEQLLRRHDVKLVCVTGGSNVTGFMPDLHRIARVAHENGALILADCAQLLAHRKIDVRPMDDPAHLDFVTAAGHKAYAPFGAGFLYGPRDLMDEAPPYLPSGGTATQVTTHGAEYLGAPDRHQGGTPNIGGVFALGRSLLFLQSIGMDRVREHELGLLRRMMQGLTDMGGITIYGPPEPERRLGVVSFNVDGVSELLAAAVLSDEWGVAVRNGRFCAHIYMDRLLALPGANGGTASQSAQEREPLTGAVRASLGLYNDEQDVDRFLEGMRSIRDHRWIGRYKTRGDTMNAEFAGRCADKWMESTAEGEGPAVDPESALLGYDFQVLQPDGPCRSYLIADPATREAAIVDPLRMEVDRYLGILDSKGYRLRYTIETHTHADHLSGSARLKELAGSLMLMHAASPAPCVDRPLHDRDTIRLGDLVIEVIATPGHTHDSVCLLLPGRVLTGDTLLIGGCGRTDLPTGDGEAMYGSLQRLIDLPAETLVLPAHDYDGRRASTIERERRTNPRLRDQTLREFTAALAKSDLPKPAGLHEVLATNQKCL
jgi:selenocysteine lyase/cysteine desulfurase/glyoxylase-like metal-dependent hydrolase (beta-lactamase superfamily II)/rhodanese-related sulfurtransferase